MRAGQVAVRLCLILVPVVHRHWLAGNMRSTAAAVLVAVLLVVVADGIHVGHLLFRWCFAEPSLDGIDSAASFAGPGSWRAWHFHLWKELRATFPWILSLAPVQMRMK